MVHRNRLQSNVALAYFVPLLIGHGGNAGGQVVGTLLAKLPQGQRGLDHLSALFAKEFATASVVGTTLALVSAPLLLGIGYASGVVAPAVVVTVMLTLALLTLLAATLAMLIVFLARVLDLDAATFAPPATTTLIDALGLLVYFHTAQVVFAAYGTPLSS